MPLIEKRTIIKNEIDYEKLSNAIAKAINENKSDIEEAILVNSIEKALTNIKNKEEEENNKLIMTSGFFSMIPILTLGLLSLLSYIFSLTALGMAFYNFNGFTDKFQSYISIALIGLLLSYISGGATHEIYHIKDFNRIIAITSTFTSIVAAIIAIVTLIITYKRELLGK